MNPISSGPAVGRSEATRDAAQVPGDIAALFAMMFAATVAPPQPAPVVPSGPTDPSGPEATPCAEGEVPPTPPGGWPGGSSSGLPAFPAVKATGRPRLESPGLRAAFEDLAPVRRDLAANLAANLADGAPEPDPPAATETLSAAASKPGKLTLPDGLAPPVRADQAPVLAAAIAAATQPARPAVAGKDAKPAPEGKPLLADSATDGARQAGRGKGRSGARTAQDGNDAANTGTPSAFSDPRDGTAPPAPVSTTPPHAYAAGVTPARTPPPDVPGNAVGAPAAAVEVPAEPAKSANPSHATVSFDTGDGQEGRLRVSLRGDTLRATIQLPDAAAAQRLEQDLGELSKALRGHGFEQARLTIDAPRAASNTERGHDDSQPREHKNLRDERSHSGERNARRERGSSRQER